MAEHRTLPDSLTRHLKPRADVEIIRDAVETIAQAMERLHRTPFKYCVNHDVCLVMVNRDRDGGAE